MRLVIITSLFIGLWVAEGRSQRDRYTLAGEQSGPSQKAQIRRPSVID